MNYVGTNFCRLNRPLKINNKGKYSLILKSITMINPVAAWFEVTQYDDKKAMSIENLVESTWMSRYPWTYRIMYDCVSEFLGHKFKMPELNNNMLFLLK